MTLNKTTGASEMTADNQRIDIREQQLFRSLDLDNDQHVTRYDLEKVLLENGLRLDDNRFVTSLRLLKEQEETIAKRTETSPRECSIEKADFCRAIRPNIQLIERVLQGKLLFRTLLVFARKYNSFMR